jgi:hypothetical protein
MSPRSRRNSRRLTVAVAVIVAAGVLAGGVIAGRIGWTDDAARLDAALADAPATRLVEIPSGDGLSARGVFAQVTSTGHVCLTDAPLDSPLMGGGGCNPADDPLGGRAFSASLAYDGGPAIQDVKDARLIGLASSEVASMRVEMSDGSSRQIKLKKAKVGSSEFQAYGYRIKKADLKKSLGPTAVVAFDADGTEIDRKATGIGN